VAINLKMESGQQYHINEIVEEIASNVSAVPEHNNTVRQIECV